MATNPFDQFDAPSGPVYGAPDPEAANRFEDQVFQRRSDARADVSQSIAVDAAARAAAADARAAEAADRARREWEAAHNPDGSLKTSVGKPTEAQQKVATLLTRIRGGAQDIQSIAQNDPAAQAPGYLESLRGDLTAGGIAGAPLRSFAGEDRRIVHDAQRDVLDALLTLGTGAAYNAEQLTGQMAAYFPSYGDSQREIEIKNDRLQRLIEAAKVQAGPQWGEVEQAIAPFMQPVGTIRGDDGGSYDPENGLTVNVTDTSPDNGGGSGGSNPPGGSTLDALARGTSSVVEGLASIPAIVVDPISTTLGRALGYDNYTSDFARTVREDLGLPENRDNLANTIIRGGSSALAGSALARGVSGLVNSGPVQSALATFGATPLRDAAAGAGSGLGGEIGRQVGGTTGQVIGTLAGGVGGYSGANAIARRVAGESAPNALLSAADRVGVEMLPADVGGTGTRMATGATRMTLGGIPMAEGAERSIGTAQAARNRIASGTGQVSDDAGVGQAVRRGFRDFEKNSEARAAQLYERVSVPNDSKVQLGQTRQALGEVTRGMQSNPELSRLWANHPRLRSTLESLTPTDVSPQGREAFIAASDKLSRAQDAYQVARSNVTSAQEIGAARKAVDDARAEVQAAQEMASAPPTGGELSWEDMKRFRSIVGEIIGQPGVASDGSDIAGLRKLYAALSSDMEVSAAQSGPKALREFRRANQYWRGRENRLEEVFSGLFGNRDQRSDEAVSRTINQWAQSGSGDFSRLARTIRSLPEDEANTVRATLIQKMGNATPANGGAEVFSPDVFATQWRSLSDRAKTVLFPNKQHRQDLQDLATVTDAMKKAGEYRNTSKTGLATNFTAQGALAIANLPAAVMLASGQFGLGKLLASPRFARALASTRRIPEDQAARKLNDQLSTIAAREPALANDAKALQDYLAQAFGQSPVRAAASEQEQDRRRKPVR